ncbi:hypothetical protein [Kitasatospora sp. NPDC059571]|uniref:hypothetical protein n=1 Tax=Kitasatospora sp. NPDC059571 TaxID=3346871 RepID=UPI0036C644BB
MPKTPTPGPTDIEAIIGGATLREDTVELCLAGHLQGEYESLERKLADASAMVGDSLAGGPRVPIAQRMQEIRDEMRTHLVTFRLRAMPPKAWSDLVAAHPGAEGQLYDPDTLGPAAIAACTVEPAMTLEQYGRLAERLTYGQQEALADAVWRLNTQAARTIPFSLLASATAASHTGEK